MPFNCVLVGQGSHLTTCGDHLLQRGHRISSVISDCPEVSTWAQKLGILRIDPSEDQAKLLQREPFDYLFSIINHAITSPQVLALPRLGAINYHDSALPAYSGFNATAWSILDGQTQHGITWHRMSTNVDAGTVLLQKTFPISEDDTAFSLAGKASGMALSSFAELVKSLEQNTFVETPPRVAQNFHYKSDRPGLPILDWNQSAASVLRLIRALDFGAADSWMTRAKFRTPTGSYICVGAASKSTQSTNTPAGTLVKLNNDRLEISVADGSVLLSDLTLIDGESLDQNHIDGFGLRVGLVLPLPSETFTKAVIALDREVTKSERYWLRKLERAVVPELAELKLLAPKSYIERVSIPLSDHFYSLTLDEQQATVVAGLAAYLGRVGTDVNRIDIGLYANQLPSALETLYAPIVPLSLNYSDQSSWIAFATQASQEIKSCLQRNTYARDIWTRYASLRSKPEISRHSPIAISLTEFTGLKLPVGVCLLVAQSTTSRRLELVFDTGSLSKLHADRLAARLAHSIDWTIQHKETSLSALPLVTPQERELLLHTFQNTNRPDVNFSCVHQLFSTQVARTPTKTAISFRDQSLTYQQLDAQSDRLANHLQKLGAGPDHLIAISIERSLDMVVGLLAILKAGAAYVPLDPAYPKERLSVMLEDSGARWLLTQNHLQQQLPPHSAQVVLVDATIDQIDNLSTPQVLVEPHHLAYVIFTSGSTGRPKGVMVEHRNVANFFAGMDERVGTEPGVWLAVTSISFDISVLEIFWTLTRGFEVVIQEEGDRASLLKSQKTVVASNRPMDFGLFYFASDSTDAPTTNAYRVMMEGARFADTHGFNAVWTPERHFHSFGGLYPSPAVTSAAIAAITSKVELRAGSVVIPLHDPIRVAEDWSVVDNISQGRVGLSFAFGWHANDFALKPENYERRREIMQESIDTVLRLWAGEKIKVKNGLGDDIEVAVHPRPIRERPPMWVASAGNIETFRATGRSGYNVLTNMLGQDIKTLAANIAAYREARRESGHSGDGVISVMLHTFVTDDDEKARKLAHGPFCNYMATSYDLVKVAPWMFPAFKPPSQSGADSLAFDPSRFDANDVQALLDHAFDRYFETAGLFGTPEKALGVIEQLKSIGVNDIACLVDFGIDQQVVLDNLVHLDKLRQIANPSIAVTSHRSSPLTISEQFERHPITHFQCTPSMARMLIADGTLSSMKSLKKFLLGGEALPVDLVQKLTHSLEKTEFLNMYGPTETTVWSTTAQIGHNGDPITIGGPIANTQIRILDRHLELSPLGTPGELCIGGAGVVRGYLNKPDMTAERFIQDPYDIKNRLYRTGDLARYQANGTIEYIGRIDQQVKVNGYRIELGEIETVLGRHPAIKEAVVAVKSNTSGAELVAYIIESAGSSQNTPTQQNTSSNLDSWKARWDAAYSQRTGASNATTRFNTSGWLDSFTGEPIPHDHMREWLDQTTNRILALQPRRVLELGCGTGMILYACLPHVEHYTAVDLSPYALKTIRDELTPDERLKVTLLNSAAHELESIETASCDLVIINSVAQYFPSSTYLMQVLEKASRVLTDGGKIFLGDIRSLEEARSFHTLVELHKAPGNTPCAEIASRIDARATLEPELLISNSFFSEMEKNIPRLTLVSSQLKQGKFSNEMRDFRCDMVLEAGPRQTKLDVLSARHLDACSSPTLIQQTLAEQPSCLLITGIKNKRLSHVLNASAHFQAGGSTGTVDSLLSGFVDAADGIEINELMQIDPRFDVETRFGRTPGTIDVLYKNKSNSLGLGVWPIALPKSSETLTNIPASRVETDRLIPMLKIHLKEFLPEYMIPSTFVQMSSFPLTPNGKIDRNALPSPTDKPRQTQTQYAIPGNELERTIADIWRDMLGLERVGRKDNIFDLGASSLLTVEANSRLQKMLNRKIPLVSMFRYPTIETLAVHLAKLIAADTSDATPDRAQSDSNAESDRQSRLDAAAARRRQARAQV